MVFGHLHRYNNFSKKDALKSKFDPSRSARILDCSIDTKLWSLDQEYPVLSQVEHSPPPRPLPALERGTEFFWTAGARGHLLIGRCDACGRYLHPPLPRCPACGGQSINPSPVSGRARVASFTVNHQRWMPGLAVPYVFAAVELVEQPELYVFTNIVGCPVDDVHIGLDVEVTFEQHGEIFLPMFRPVEKSNAR